MDSAIWPSYTSCNRAQDKHYSTALRIERFFLGALKDELRTTLYSKNAFRSRHAQGGNPVVDKKSEGTRHTTHGRHLQLPLPSVPLPATECAFSRVLLPRYAPSLKTLRISCQRTTHSYIQQADNKHNETPWLNRSHSPSQTQHYCCHSHLTRLT